MCWKGETEQQPSSRSDAVLVVSAEEEHQVLIARFGFKKERNESTYAGSVCLFFWSDVLETRRRAAVIAPMRSGFSDSRQEKHMHFPETRFVYVVTSTTSRHTILHVNISVYCAREARNNNSHVRFVDAILGRTDWISHA